MFRITRRQAQRICWLPAAGDGAPSRRRLGWLTNFNFGPYGLWSTSDQRLTAKRNRGGARNPLRTLSAPSFFRGGVRPGRMAPGRCAPRLSVRRLVPRRRLDLSRYAGRRYRRNRYSRGTPSYEFRRRQPAATPARTPSPGTTRISFHGTPPSSRGSTESAASLDVLLVDAALGPVRCFVPDVDREVGGIVRKRISPCGGWAGWAPRLAHPHRRLDASRRTRGPQVDRSRGTHNPLLKRLVQLYPAAGRPSSSC